MKLDAAQEAALARELARSLDEPVEAILSRWGFGPVETDPATAALLASPSFQEQVRSEQLRHLRNDTRLEAATALRRMLPAMSEIVQDPAAPASARVAGLTALARIAGVEGDDKDGRAFSIVINLPDGQAPALHGTAVRQAQDGS